MAELLDRHGQLHESISANLWADGGAETAETNSGQWTEEAELGPGPAAVRLDRAG